MSELELAISNSITILVFKEKINLNYTGSWIAGHNKHTNLEVFGDVRSSFLFI